MLVFWIIFAAGCVRHECVLRAYAEFFDCLTAPGVPYVNQECGDWDGDLDNDVDLLDASIVLAEMKPW